MNRTFSTYLDLVRFLSAVLVFLHHFAFPQLTNHRYDAIGAFGEDAVMIFFVLSGYVIAYVLHRENTLQTYAVNRFSRLYSVAIPALLLTVVADTVGRAANPMVYDSISNNHVLIKTIFSLALSNQLWSIDIRFFTNVPYWSISYEFWYYVVFACLVFTHGRLRIALVAAWALFVGPCILLLLPVWLMGVATYRYTERRTVSLPIATALFVLPLPLYFLYRSLGIGSQLTSLTDPWVIALTGDEYFLHKARFFLHDYVVGALVALQFIGAHGLSRIQQLSFGRLEPMIRKAANHTFSLYLFHVPLLFCLAAISPWAAGHPLYDLTLLLGTAVIVWALAPITEARKDIWRGVFWSLIASIAWRRFFGIQRAVAIDTTQPTPSQAAPAASRRSWVITGAWLTALISVVVWLQLA